MKHRFTALLLIFVLFAVSAAPAGAADTAVNLPFDGMGYAGFFIFEARGNKVTVPYALEAIQSWTTEMYGTNDVTLLEQTQGVVATGMTAVVHVGDAEARYGILIIGDPAKTGMPGLTQLVTTARALRGELDSDPAAVLAADLNLSGEVDLTDLVQTARYLTEPDSSGPSAWDVPYRLPHDAAVSENIHRQYYMTWSSPVTSYLYENPAGNLVRVEYLDEKVIVEEYNAAFLPASSLVIEPELPVWGGFFAGENYNFLIFGQTNDQEDDSREVIRIVKYDKAWNRLGASSLYGGNTRVPFDAGSLRCAEAGGVLYVRTSHLKYMSADGVCHQSSMMLVVRQNDMQITDSQLDTSNGGAGYTSHSFNQFLLTDERNWILAVDHGDGYPRGIYMMLYNADAGEEVITKPYPAIAQGLIAVSFPGGGNQTGASLGGVASTSNGYVIAYNDDGQGGGGHLHRDVYLDFIPVRKDHEAKSTKLTENMRTMTPQVVATGPEGGYVIWIQEGEDGTGFDFRYARYSADGTVGESHTADASMSDCQPIVWNGKAVWYVTAESDPFFFTLDETGLKIY